jgi:uncharacterized delta-60 repeat protein
VTTPVGSADDSANGVKLQSDGKIVVAGFSNIAGNNDFLVVRYNPDGTLDTSFNGTGKVTTAIGGGDDTGVGLALQEDGKIVMAGYSHNGSNYDIAVARYLVSPPDAVTAAATSVTVGQATLNGSVNPKASVTTALFEYGLTTSYGTSVTIPVKPWLCLSSQVSTPDIRLAGESDLSLPVDGDKSGRYDERCGHDVHHWRGGTNRGNRRCQQCHPQWRDDQRFGQSQWVAGEQCAGRIRPHH